MTTIQDVITVRGVGRQGATLSVGIVLDGGLTSWGDCVFVADGVNLSAETKHLTNSIKPALMGKTLTTLPELLAPLDQLTYQVTKRYEVQPAAPAGVSRRSILSAFTVSDKPDPIIETETTTHPISAGLRYGVSQALVNAFARHLNLSPFTIISSEYALEASASGLPLHGELTGLNVNGIPRLLWEHVTSIGFTTSGANAADSWGDRGEKLQRFIKSIHTEIMDKAGSGKKPAIHLNLNGCYSDLFEDKMGKVLGAAIGLRSEVAPCELRLVNIINADDQKSWGRLAELFRLRKYTSPIGVSVTHADEIATWAESAVTFVQIVPAAVGTIDQSVRLIRAAQAAGLDVYIEGDSAETPHSTEQLTALSLAANAKQLLATTDESRLHAFNQLQKLRHTSR